MCVLESTFHDICIKNILTNIITIFYSDQRIGALTSPKQNGSAYVLLHHVMGEAAGKKGVWAYVEGNKIFCWLLHCFVVKYSSSYCMS